MATTLNEFRYEIREIINQYSSDSTIDNRFLDSLISGKRERVLINNFNRFNKTIPSMYYQTLSCVEVIDVDQSECCDIKTGCYIKRTKEKIPRILSLSDGELIDKVGPAVTVSIPFTIIPYRRAEFWSSSRYNKNKIAAFLNNGYMYFIAKDNIQFKMLERVSIRAVFVNPMEVASFTNCDGTPCFTPDDPFPLEGNMWEYIKTDILQNDLRIKLSIPRDAEADNADNIIDSSKPGGNG